MSDYEKPPPISRGKQALVDKIPGAPVVQPRSPARPTSPGKQPRSATVAEAVLCEKITQ
jgi:hypothetical protein